MYNTLSLFLFMKKLEDMTSFPPETVKVKAICDKRIFRIDNKAKNEEVAMTISLMDLEIHDGVPIEVELKEEEEEEQVDNEDAQMAAEAK